MIFVVLFISLCLAQNNPIPEGTQWTELRRDDFASGTYLITTPGYYRLVEDIEFNPLAPSDADGAYDAYYLRPSDFTSGGGKYDDQAYHLGFWSAISILTDHVTLDLGGRTIGQSKAHNLMNRFFHVIQLGGLESNGYYTFTPFNTTQPKANFITIQNGRIGRTATNGIYGLLNNNILIKDITFDKFEKNAVVLGGSVNVEITNCHAFSSKEVAVNQLWFTAINIRPYVDALAKLNPAYTLNVGGALVPVTTIQSDLRALVNLVYKRVINENNWLDGAKDYEEVSALFGNDWRRPDSNCGGFAFSRVGAYPPLDGVSPTNITIIESSVMDLECAPFETVSLTGVAGISMVNGVTVSNFAPIQDARGNSFALFGFHWDWTKATEFNSADQHPWDAVTVQDPLDLSQTIYKGNAVSNAQAIVGKAILEGILLPTATQQTGNSRFNQDILTWIGADPATSTALLSNYLKAGTLLKRPFICSGDVQSAPLLGGYAYSFLHAQNVHIERVRVQGLKNWGAIGSGICLYKNHTRMISGAAFPGYNGADAKAFFFSSSENVHIKSVFVADFHSNWGSLLAFDVIQNSELVTFEGIEVRDAFSGKLLQASDRKAYENNPTRWPSAVAFHTDVTTKNVTLLPYCVNNLNAPSGHAFKTSLANNTVDNGETFSCHIGEYPWWIWFLLAIVTIIFIVALIAVLMACLEQNKEVEGEHYTQMN